MAVQELEGRLFAEWERICHGEAGATPSPVFERTRDEPSGQSYLEIRMPKPEVVDRVAQALPALLESLRP